MLLFLYKIPAKIIYFVVHFFKPLPMIQRIQSVYLLAAFILFALCFFIPMAGLISSTGMSDSYNLQGLHSGKSIGITGNLLMIFSVTLAIFIFANIFQYNNRKRQIKVCFFLIILLLISNAIGFYQLMMIHKTMGLMISYQIPLIFPIISAILIYLASRGIKKDEELVRSYDRLR
jgi:hypothetical protein